MAEPRDRSLPCIVCISGRPSVGKSTAAAVLHRRHGWPVLEADEVGAEVLDEAQATTRALELGRPRFAYSNAARVEFEAPESFRDRLRAQLIGFDSPVILVGLRSVATLRWLRAHFPRRICVLYLSAGTRVCQQRFALATGRPRQEYGALLEAAIECEQPGLHRLAQRVVANHVSLDTLCARLAGMIDRDGRLHRTPREPCSRCGEVRPVHQRSGPDRAPLCRQCYEWRFAEPCSRCQELRPVHTRDPEGKPLCSRCYQRSCNVRVCVCCGRSRPVYRRNLDGDPICKECRQRGADLEHTAPRSASSRVGLLRAAAGGR